MCSLNYFFLCSISNKDVNIVTEGGIISDVDLQIEIPKEKLALPPMSRNNTLRRRVRNLFQRMTAANGGSCNDVVFIRDVISVTDPNGTTYDLDLDLKVELDQGLGASSGECSRVESRFTDASGLEDDVAQRDQVRVRNLLFVGFNSSHFHFLGTPLVPSAVAPCRRRL